jgi:predicted transcriptional regulator
MNVAPSAPMLFSIRPQYIAAFLDGSKQYEYRTRVPSVKTGDQILIYESRGRGKVVAVADVLDVVVGTVEEVREQTNPPASYDDYFAGRTSAVAIRLQVRELAQPIALSQSAPQAWARWQGEWPLSA